MFDRKYKKLRKIIEMNIEKYYRLYVDDLCQGNVEKSCKWLSKYWLLTDVLRRFDES